MFPTSIVDYARALESLKEHLVQTYSRKLPVKDPFHGVVFPMLASSKKRVSCFEALEILQKIKENLKFLSRYSVTDPNGFIQLKPEKKKSEESEEENDVDEFEEPSSSLSDNWSLSEQSPLETDVDQRIKKYDRRPLFQEAKKGLVLK
jgi:hypothetical protein